MSARALVWAIGLVATLALTIWLGSDGATREFCLPAGFVALGICALIAEISRFWTVSRSRNVTSLPPGLRAADGVVDVTPVQGVASAPCSVRPEFGRFVAIRDPDPSDSFVEKLAPINPTLLGRVALVSVFVGHDGVRWTEAEIASGIDSVKRSGLWIEREAARHCAPVNVALADVYFEVVGEPADLVEISFQGEASDVGPMESDALTKALVMASRTALSLGFLDVADWMRRINARIAADAVVWLVHVRQAGRSLAIPAESSEIPGVGLAVCYSQESSFPEPLSSRPKVDPTTVAHELLHLFGASDKYGTALSSFEKGSVSPLEIMRLNHDSLFRMRIDPLTAVEIGWGPSCRSGSANEKTRHRSG